MPVPSEANIDLPSAGSAFAAYEGLQQADGTSTLRWHFYGTFTDLLGCSADDFLTRFSDRTLPIQSGTCVHETGFYDCRFDALQRRQPWFCEIEWLHPTNGSIVWLLFREFHHDGQQPTTTGVMMDITSLKVQQDAESGQNQLLSAHLENTPLAVIEWRPDLTVLRWNNGAEAMFGWSEQERVGQNVMNDGFVYTGDMSRVAEVIDELLSGKVPRNILVNRNRDKYGRVLTCEWHNSAVTDRNGQVVSILSLVMDKTEQNQLQNELQLREERLRTTLAYSKMLIWDRDYQRQNVEYSHHYGEFFGMPELGFSIPLGEQMLVVHETHRQDIRDQLARAMENENEFTFRFRGHADQPDHRPRWFETYGRIVRDAGGVVLRIVGVTKDVTVEHLAREERQALAQQMLEARKYDSLGVLAGGVAHDFNNLLTIILGHASLVRSQLGPAHQLGTNLAEIDSACQRAANLCQQLSAYAGVSSMALVPLSLAELIRTAEPLLRTECGNVGLRLTLQAGLTVVNAEPYQLRQALRSLVINAVESHTNQDGMIRIELDSVQVERFTQGVEYPLPPRPGEYQRITIRDTGIGMTAAMLEKAFEPFYTTKFTGRGLGLAAVFGIIRKHRGGIRMTSTPEVGTTVELYLPVPTKRPTVAVSPVAMIESRTVSTQELHRNRSREVQVLLVDDDANVRKLIELLLKEEGYKLTVCRNGREALNLFEVQHGGLTLGIVDMMMPGLGGLELISAMRQVKPNFPVIIISGYSDREVSPDVAASGPTMFLHKPFQIDQLMKAINKLVEAK
jgi:two-component system, cell cycle sensor histidine kinase and response regulator CckA